MKKSNISIYGVCGILICFYLVVLYLGMKPNVSEEYEMYYLSHKLADWPGYDNLSYDLGTHEYCTSKQLVRSVSNIYKGFKRRGQGWEYPKVFGTSNIPGETAHIYIRPTETSIRRKLMLDIGKYGLEDPETSEIIDVSEALEDTKVYVDGEYIGSFNGSGIYYFTVPEITKDKTFDLTFETETVKFSILKFCIY